MISNLSLHIKIGCGFTRLSPAPKIERLLWLVLDGGLALTKQNCIGAKFPKTPTTSHLYVICMKVKVAQAPGLASTFSFRVRSSLVASHQNQKRTPQTSHVTNIPSSTHSQRGGTNANKPSTHSLQYSILSTMSISPIITFKAGMCDVDVSVPIPPRRLTHGGKHLANITTTRPRPSHTRSHQDRSPAMSTSTPKTVCRLVHRTDYNPIAYAIL